MQNRLFVAAQTSLNFKLKRTNKTSETKKKKKVIKKRTVVCINSDSCRDIPNIR